MELAYEVSKGRAQLLRSYLELGGIWQVIHHRYEFLLNFFNFFNI